MKTNIFILLLIFISNSSFGDYWTQRADFGGTNRADAAAFSIGSKGYLGTGYDGSYDAQWWAYDPIVDSWTQKADVGIGMVEAVAFSIDNFGYELNAPSGIEFWQYDPLLNTWSQKADFLGVARQAAVAWPLNGKGYVVSGLSSSSLNDLWEYDPLLNIWTQRSDLTGAARHYAAGFAINGKGYIGTGTNTTTGMLNDFWEYDQVTDTWMQRADVPGPLRVEASAFAMGGFGYLGMGSGNGNYYNDFYQYDPTLNTWTQKADFSGGPREEASQFTIGNRGFVGTGYDGLSAGVTKRDLWEYHPEDSTTSVNEINNETILSIFPNPVTDVSTVKIKSTVDISNTVMNIYDETGRLIKTQKIFSKNIIVRKGNLKKGNYVLEIADRNQGINRIRFVIN